MSAFNLCFVLREDHEKLCAKLKRLGDLPSFPTFSHGLHERGMSLECVEFPGPASFQLCLVANGVAHGIQSFDLQADFARWLHRWDGIYYTVPLSPGEQRFIAARHQWLCHSGHVQDLPRERWLAFAVFINGLGAFYWREVMAVCFGSKGAMSVVRSEGALKLGVKESDLDAVLGPEVVR